MSNTDASLKQIGNFITWNILPDQIGYKFPENFIDVFDNIDGIYVQSGTAALIQEGEKLLILENGTHQLGKAELPTENRKSSLSSLINRIFSSRKSKTQISEIKNKNKLPAVSVSQVRTGRFHMEFKVNEIVAPIGTTNLRLRVVAVVSDIQAFHTQFLIDKQILSTSDLASELEKLIDGTVRQFVEKNSFNTLRSPNGLIELEDILIEKWKSLEQWGLQIESIQMGAPENNSESEFIKTENELKKREKALEQAITEAQFMETYSAFERNCALKETEETLQSEKEKQDVEQKKLKQNYENEKFIRIFDFQKKLETAKDTHELQHDLRELKKSQLLSESDFNLYAQSLENKEKDAAHLTEIVKLNQQNKIEQLKLEYEQALNQKQKEYDRKQNLDSARSEVTVKKIHDEYSDERTKITEEQLYKKQKSKLEILKEAQEIRNQREEQEHKLSMEKIKFEKDFELKKEQIRLENFNKMTSDQILAANNDISPEAAEALSKICSSRNNEETVEFLKDVLEKKSDDMQKFLESQMHYQREFNSSMFRKEEIERYLHVIEKTTGLPGVKTEKNEIICSKCGEKIQNNGIYCPFCGERR